MAKEIGLVTPIALYNADKKELVGLFRDTVECATYVFPKPYNCTQISIFTTCARRKGTLREKPLGFKMAVRFATVKQIELLPSEGFVIFGDYKKHSQKKRFTNLRAATTKNPYR